MENTEALLAESEAKNRLNTLIAITVAILSAFMAVTKIKDDNIVQAMLQAKTDAVDTWAEYQSKKIKHHLSELGYSQAVALQASGNITDNTRFNEQINRYQADITRYQQEETVLQKKAKGFEDTYNALNIKDDQFDLSDAALSLALAMLAVTALTSKRWLMGISWLFAGFGIFIGMAGLLGFNVHPDALIRLLT